MNFTQRISTTIKTLRGNITQKQLSEQLGFEFNVVNRWESGSREITWPEFVQLARYCKVDLRYALSNTIDVVIPEFIDFRDVMLLFIDNKERKLQLKDIFSDSKISKLASRSTKLTLQEVLQSIELIYGNADKFLFLCVGYESSENLDEKIIELNNHLCKNRQLLIVEYILNTEGYKNLPEHSSQYISNLLGLKMDEVKLLIEKMLKAGILQYNGSHYQRSTPISPDPLLGVSPQVKSELVFNLREDFANVGKLPPEERPELYGAPRFFATNSELDAEILMVITKCLLDLKTVINKYDGDPNQKFTNVGILNWEFCKVIGDNPLYKKIKP